MPGSTVEAVLERCRACNSESSQYRSLFKLGCIMDEMTTLAELLSFCTNLIVLPDEVNLPSNICDECTQVLAQSYQFKKMVLESNVDLRAEFECSRQPETNKSVGMGHTKIDITASCPILSDESMATSMTNKSQCNQVLSTRKCDSTKSTETSMLEEVDDVLEEELVTKEHIEYVNQDYSGISEADEEECVLMDNVICQNVIVVENSVDEDIVQEDEEEQKSVMHDIGMSEVDENSQGYEIIVEDPQDNDIENCADDDCITEDSQFEAEVFDMTIEQWSESNPDEGNEVLSTEIVDKISRAKIRNSRSSVEKQSNREFKCTVCQKQLSNSNSFKYHMQLHSDARPYLCNLCGESFKTRNAYDGHISTHNPNNPNKCELCGKCYRQPSSLRSHMLTHTGEKPFKCHICGKGMTQKSGYKKHMLVHTGEKPHSCDICFRTFRYSSNLITHKRCHSTERPFECNECGKCFNSSSQLNRHKYMHTGERPFSCDRCDKTFKRRISLTSHLQMHEKGATEMKHIENTMSPPHELKPNLVLGL